MEFLKNDREWIMHKSTFCRRDQDSAKVAEEESTRTKGSPVIGERMMAKNEWPKEEQWQDKGRQGQKSWKMQEKSLELKLNQDARKSPIDARRQEKVLLSWKEILKLILKGLGWVNNEPSEAR